MLTICSSTLSLELNLSINGISSSSDFSSKDTFIRTLLYGEGTDEIRRFAERGIYIDGNLFERIQNRKFEEYLGVYYQEELQEKIQGGEMSETPDANKTAKRVITYKEI